MRNDLRKGLRVGETMLLVDATCVPLGSNTYTAAFVPR